MRRLIAILVALLFCAPATGQRVTFAYPGIGTSGATVPLLNGANTWSATNTHTGAVILNQASVPVLNFGATTASWSSIAVNASDHTTLQAILGDGSQFSPFAASRLSAGGTGGVDIASNGPIDWTNSVSNPRFAGTADTTLCRLSAGIIQVGSASTCASTGALVMATATFNAVASDTATTDASACLRSSDGLLLKGTGTLGICLGTSSARFKHGIAPLAPGLAEIMRLRPVSYYLNAGHGDPAKQLYGFTAEDMRPVLPKLVGLDAGGNPSSADYLGLVPVLVKAVQEQQAEIEALKRQIANDNVRLASAGVR